MDIKSTEALATIASNPNAWGAWATSTDRIPVFSVTKADEESGESELVTFTMPAKPNPGLALKFLKMARDNGELATVWLIEQAIGADGYDALADELINYDGDPVALLQGIAQRIQKVAMGGLEAPKA